MPVNSVTEQKKVIEKTRFNLSLNRNNATRLNDENWKPNENFKENKNPCKHNKENKPLKRPLKSIYSNTLSAAKRLKPLTESSKPAGIV